VAEEATEVAEVAAEEAEVVVAEEATEVEVVAAEAVVAEEAAVVAEVAAEEAEVVVAEEATEVGVVVAEAVVAEEATEVAEVAAEEAEVVVAEEATEVEVVAAVVAEVVAEVDHMSFALSSSVEALLPSASVQKRKRDDANYGCGRRHHPRMSEDNRRALAESALLFKRGKMINWKRIAMLEPFRAYTPSQLKDLHRGNVRSKKRPKKQAPLKKKRLFVAEA
jgi:hypothetical protein